MSAGTLHPPFRPQLGKFEANARVRPAWAYTVGRVAGYYPLFILVQVLFGEHAPTPHPTPPHTHQHTHTRDDTHRQTHTHSCTPPVAALPSACSTAEGGTARVTARQSRQRDHAAACPSPTLQVGAHPAVLPAPKATNCHTGTLPPCPLCNPQLASPAHCHCLQAPCLPLRTTFTTALLSPLRTA